MPVDDDDEEFYITRGRKSPKKKVKKTNSGKKSVAVEEKKGYSQLFYATMVEMLKIVRKEEDFMEELTPILQISFNALKNHDFKLDFTYEIPKPEMIFKSLPERYGPIG